MTFKIENCFKQVGGFYRDLNYVIYFCDKTTDRQTILYSQHQDVLDHVVLSWNNVLTSLSLLSKDRFFEIRYKKD